METIETTQYKGLTVKIHPDYDGGRDFSEEFTNPEPFHTYGRWNGYTLFETEGRGDEFMAHVLEQYHNEIAEKYKSLAESHYLEDYDHGYDDMITMERAEELVQKWMDAELIMMPIYVYEHGGITMRTSGFSCQWDSGQAGFIYISKAEARKMWGKAMSKKQVQWIDECMTERVAYLAAICEGSIYGYSIEDEEGDVLDSCWGFVETEYPMEKTYVYKEAMDSAKYLYKKRLTDHLAKKKAEIMNRVPVLARTTFLLA